MSIIYIKIIIVSKDSMYICINMYTYIFYQGNHNFGYNLLINNKKEANFRKLEKFEHRHQFEALWILLFNGELKFSNLIIFFSL